MSRSAPGFDLAKLAGDGRIAAADVQAVPAGKYAKAALEKLGAWTAAEPKLAHGGKCARGARFVARGEAPLGIVYETDAKVEPKVKIIGAFPDGSHPPIVYPVAATRQRSRRPRRISLSCARGTAKAIFEHYGFTFLVKAGLVTITERVFDLTPDEWTAVRLSLRIAVVATAGRAAVRHRGRLAAGAQEFLGQGAARRPRASAAGAAAGRDRLSAADLVRPQGRRSAPFSPTISASCSRSAGPARRSPAASWVSAAGARDPAVVRGDRPAAGRRRGDARRQPRLDVRHRDAAARAARHHRGHGAVLSPRRSANSARPSRSSPTSRARRRPSRPRSTPTRRCRAATPRRCGWSSSRS